jgi:hypothetical protein
MTPSCFSTHVSHPDSLSLTTCIPSALKEYKSKMGATILSLFSHFLYREQEMFLCFCPISPHSYPAVLNTFPNKLYY